VRFLRIKKSMKDKLEKIIEELFTLDPDLKDKESEIRPLVSRLLSLKPDIEVDRKFQDSLRESLTKPEIQETKSKNRQRGWVFRFISVGAVVFAVFLLTMTTVVEVPNSEDQFGIAGLPEDLLDGLVVKDQSPGESVLIESVFLNKPGFVAIYSTSEGTRQRVIGISEVLMEGEHIDVMVALEESTEEGMFYAVILFEKDGGDRQNPSVLNDPWSEEGGAVDEAGFVARTNQ
jgi:hypothetical protein